MSPTDTYLDYLVRERTREVEESARRAREVSKVERAQSEEEPLPTRPGGLRRRLGRKLVSLGLRLDPQGEGPAAS